MWQKIQDTELQKNILFMDLLGKKPAMGKKQDKGRDRSNELYAQSRDSPTTKLQKKGRIS